MANNASQGFNFDARKTSFNQHGFDSAIRLSSDPAVEINIKSNCDGCNPVAFGEKPWKFGKVQRE